MPQENQPEDDMLVIRWFEVLAKLVGSEEQIGLEAKISSVAFVTICIGLLRTSPGHVVLAVIC
jgi:hypothetical protein